MSPGADLCDNILTMLGKRCVCDSIPVAVGEAKWRERFEKTICCFAISFPASKPPRSSNIVNEQPVGRCCVAIFSDQHVSPVRGSELRSRVPNRNTFSRSLARQWPRAALTVHWRRRFTEFGTPTNTDGHRNDEAEAASSERPSMSRSEATKGLANLLPGDCAADEWMVSNASGCEGRRGS